MKRKLPVIFIYNLRSRIQVRKIFHRAQVNIISASFFVFCVPFVLRVLVNQWDHKEHEEQFIKMQ